MPLKLAREKLIKHAIQISKNKKIMRWVSWIATKLRKKGYLADLDICAYDNVQIVGKVMPYGGAYVFWSEACDGCPIGIDLIEQYVDKKQLPKELPCALLRNALISTVPISEGEVVRLLPLKLNR